MKTDQQIRDKIIELFNKTDIMSDGIIHQKSYEWNLDTHKFEGDIYSIISDIVHGRPNGLIGKHNDVPDSDFDQDELAAGIKIEYEHTSNLNVAKCIAKDHLAEIPDYYTRLAKMEQEAKNEKLPNNDSAYVFRKNINDAIGV